jgi:hypothetical protein
VSDGVALAIFLGAGVALFGGLMLFWRHAGASLYRPPLPYYRTAARWLWTEVYGQPDRKMPNIFWIHINGKNRCAPGCFRSGSTCVGGQALLDVNVINVAWEDGHHAWLADTALAHELAHFARLVAGGNGAAHDAAHTSLAEAGAIRLRAWEKVRA